MSSCVLRRLKTEAEAEGGGAESPRSGAPGRTPPTSRPRSPQRQENTNDIHISSHIGNRNIKDHNTIGMIRIRMIILVGQDDGSCSIAHGLRFMGAFPGLGAGPPCQEPWAFAL